MKKMITVTRAKHVKPMSKKSNSTPVAVGADPPVAVGADPPIGSLDDEIASLIGGFSSTAVPPADGAAMQSFIESISAVQSFIESISAIKNDDDRYDFLVSAERNLLGSTQECIKSGKVPGTWQLLLLVYISAKIRAILANLIDSVSADLNKLAVRTDLIDSVHTDPNKSVAR